MKQAEYTDSKKGTQIFGTLTCRLARVLPKIRNGLKFSL